ncbi:NB-ARC domains-containing protein [Tanacetum coccineum]
MATTSIPHRWKYDVFVSFRGEDIRKNFMDHLFKAFKQKGIRAFRDDNELPKGEEISPHLYKAIEESRFLIVIFSKEYASSSWCLRELVKILECKQTEHPKHEVRIIFYDVKPDVVRKQKISYEEAFRNHEVSHCADVGIWKKALSMAADLSGYDLQDMTNGYESEFIDRISKDIFLKLCDGPLHVGKNLVAIDSYFDKLDLSRFVRSPPLALKVLGLSLYGKTEKQWKSELGQLKEHPNPEIQQVLRLSYDGLNLCQKNILLDIACSFIGVNCDFATSTLIQKQWQGECIEEGRLGTEQIDDAVNFSGSLEFLSNELRLLYWHGCPFELLPSDFYPQDIVVIDLSYSNIKQLWTTPKKVENNEAKALGAAMGFPSTVDMYALQVLNLSGCLNVNQLPQAFWSRWWTSIRGFIWNQQHPQRSFSLEGSRMLKSLNLSFCNLEQVPDGLGGLSFLKKLNLEGNGFTSLPGSLSQLSHLQTLELDGCKRLEVLPELPHSLETVLISDTECLDSSVTSQSSTNRFSSFLRYVRIQNNRRGLFSMPGSSIANMDMIYDGNSMPNWFTNKSMGNQVKVELPLDWSFSKVRGYGICVVFKRKRPSAWLGYYVKNFDGDFLGRRDPLYDVEYFGQKLEEAKNFVTYCFYEDETIEVKECGARIVCDEDLDEEGDLSMFEDVPTLSQHGGVCAV